MFKHLIVPLSYKYLIFLGKLTILEYFYSQYENIFCARFDIIK
jgi:hypothetical protein